MVATTDRQTHSVAGMFHALTHRNFRLFWAGAFLSNSGTWMQTVAQSILVYKLTSSPFWLGVDSFMATVPGLLLTLFGGALADKVNRRRLVIFTQVGAGLSALTLAVFVTMGVVKDSSDIWIVLVLSFVTGCCWALAGPSYQAMTVDLVERADLANAIALNSTQFQLARVVGPTLAGVMIAYFGIQGCFYANSLSYVAIVGALWQVRFPRRESAVASEATKLTAGAEAALATGAEGTMLTEATEGTTKKTNAIWRDLVAGFRYVGGRPRVRLLLLCSGFVAMFGAPYLVLAPDFAKQVFGWGDKGVSLLMGTAGAGAFCGALLLAYLGDFPHKGKFVLGSSLSASACLMGYALAGHPVIALPLLFAVGFSMVSFFAVCNTLLQQLVTDEMRGRVMSMWILTFIGTMPIGSLIAGTAAERYGAPRTLATGGIIIALFVLFIGFRNTRLREI